MHSVGYSLRCAPRERRAIPYRSERPWRQGRLDKDGSRRCQTVARHSCRRLLDKPRDFVSRCCLVHNHVHGSQRSQRGCLDSVRHARWGRRILGRRKIRWKDARRSMGQAEGGGRHAGYRARDETSPCDAGCQAIVCCGDQGPRARDGSVADRGGWSQLDVKPLNTDGSRPSTTTGRRCR